MSDIIQLLPDTVANQIAAGEVIQRPASVIKELVENSVDAGATTISAVVVDAGRTSIQVVDDGKGMSQTDARLAFERHATSKIRQAADLFSLTTMGFRGEALPSIAAVAQVELRTRREEDEIGTKLLINGNTFVSQEPCSCPVGSNFLVQNLFYNVPARRKFLKSNTTELNNIITAFLRIALVYPDITFILKSNNNDLYNLKAGTQKQRIVDIFGKKLNALLLPIDVDTTLCKIHGFIGKPEAARKKGVQQYFFVNGRYMRHPYFNKAIASAFERLLPDGEQIPYFIYFDVPPENIDVNIHPTKTEIKFENEQYIWQLLTATVKEALGFFNDITAIDFDSQTVPEMPVFGQNNAQIKTPEVPFNPQYNPFQKQNGYAPKPQADRNWEQLYEGLGQKQSPTAPLFDDTPPSTTPQEESIAADKAPIHYQYKGKFVMVAVKSGLMIIDQHRAHIRVLYDKYMRQAKEKKIHPQKVLFPETLRFAVNEDIVFKKIQPQLASLGFDFSDIGGATYIVNTVPTGLDNDDYVEIVRDITLSALEKTTSIVDEINHSFALNMARHAAIVYGQVLDNDEMTALVNSLFVCKDFNYTPDGKRIMCILTQTEIENLFA